MKKVLTYSFVLLLCNSSVLSARELVDSVVARVNGVNICHSVLQEPQITKSGQPFTLDEAIKEELWVQRAQSLKIAPPPASIDRQLMALRRDNNLVGLSDDQVDAKLRDEVGITMATYKKQLMRFNTVEMIKGNEMRSRANVTDQEVRDYYQENPEYVPARYNMSVATISDDHVSLSGQFTGDYTEVTWRNVGWVEHRQVAPHLQSIYHLTVDSCSEPIKYNGRFMLVKLVDKVDRRQKTIEELYGVIERRLRAEKVAKAALSLEKELYQDAVIITPSS